jgi:hypothetical protein
MLWRLGPESNRGTRLCRPVHSHSATQPLGGLPEQKREAKASLRVFGAGNEIRTRDPDLGKVVLYQLSYSRVGRLLYAHSLYCQAVIPDR